MLRWCFNNFQRQFFLWFLVIFAETVICQLNTTNIDDESLKSSILKEESSKNVHTLSRRKRYLIFPEGSSLQLVMCLTIPTYAQVGDIFITGATAALAWELPQDPYSRFMHHADPLHRSDDVKNIYYTDKKIPEQQPKSHFIANPAFAKRSVDNGEPTETEIDREGMHRNQERRGYLGKEGMDEKSVEFHRQSRTGLYEKIETFLGAMGAEGRECVLKYLCLSGQSQTSKQGSFLEEILRVIFTLPSGETFESSYHREYDQAHSSSEDCQESYPTCGRTIISDIAEAMR